jgi:hypothetical protein
LIKGANLIKIEREFISRLSEPHNHCVNQDKYGYSSEMFQYFVQNNKTYLQKDCLDLCIWEKVKQMCNCTEPLGEYNECLRTSFSNVIFLVKEYRQIKTKGIPLECFDNCPQECSIINYRTYTSYLGPLNSLFFQSNSIPESFKDDILYINVYYPRLEYTLISQIAKMNQFDLVSSAGGTLGLFIGFSFFTLVEMLEIIFELVGNYFARKFRKTPVIPIVNKLPLEQVRNNRDQI